VLLVFAAILGVPVSAAAYGFLQLVNLRPRPGARGGHGGHGGHGAA
jgi:hypothetical protein